MTKIFSRLMCSMLVGAAASSASVGAMAQDDGKPLLRQIYMTTIGATDLAKVEEAYTTTLGLKIRRRGKVAAAMAASWGAPGNGGRPYILMSSDRSPEAYVRAVETDPVAKGPAAHAPQAATGWVAFVMQVDNLAEATAHLAHTLFTVVPKAHLSGMPESVQVIGPAGEVFYLAPPVESCGAAPAQAPFAGPSMLVLGNRDTKAAHTFYAQTFKMPDARNVGDASHLSLLHAAECGNTVAIEGAPASARARPHAPGQLPPGNAVATFTTHRLDDFKVSFITPPGGNYGARKSAGYVGPAGEVVELIQDPQP